jgi:hypothetical protein
MIRIGREDEYLEIEQLERVSSSLPASGDVRVRVSVRLQRFLGSYGSVWVGKSDLEHFVEQLRVVERSRKGNARLEALSPHEFRLELRQLGSLGHFEVAVQLGRYQYSGRIYWPICLSGGSEIDPDELGSLRSGFEALLS